MSTPAPDLDPHRGLRLVTREWPRPEWSKAAWWGREPWRARIAAGLEWVRRDPRRAALAGAGILAALAALLALRPAPLPPGTTVAQVKQGPFRVSLVESGTLQALRSVTYGSTILSNQAKIVGLVPEGKLVQKGDLLVLFDAAPFEEEIRRSQALIAQASAELAQAEQDFNLQGVQNGEELAAARQKVERSRLELQDVTEGKGKLREQEAQAAVANAERELTKAKSAHEDLKPLLAEGFITRQELEKAEQQVQRAEEELALARRREQSLLQFGRPLELSQARSDEKLTRESLRQLESAANYRLEQKRAAVNGAQGRIQDANGKLELARQQLARTEVRADGPGIVVYRDVFFGSEQRKPQVGDQVWANQPLLILPDVSKMVVETRVRETDVHKVAQNQRVTVTVDAYPDLQLHGKVTLVGTLAQEERDRRGAKFFKVTVQLDGTEPRLRPGMTARVEILVEERKDALYVPLDAVSERAGRTTAWVAARSGLEAREVVLGPSNADFVVVERGLEAGDRVVLGDPSGTLDEPTH
jgi:HlyD family secretion protein